MNIKEKLDIIKYIIKATLRLLLHYPRILIPFVIAALFNLSSLFILYLVPMYPLKKILGPPIVKFFGRQYLHYPYNFILLPNLFSYVKNFLVNPLISSLMIAICIGMIHNYYTQREPSFFRNLNKALRRYIHLILVMLVMATLIYFVSRIIPFLLTKIFAGWQGVGTLNFYIVFFLIVGIESLFIYAFLAVMIKRKNILGALKESLLCSSRLFFVTYLLVFIPRLLDLGTSIIQRKQLYFMNRFMPDITLLIISLAIIVAILSDGLVYSLISNLYILKEKSGSSENKTLSE